MLLEERRYPPSAGVRGAGERASPTSTTSTSRRSGSARPNERVSVVRAVRRSSTSGSCRTRSGSSAASSTSRTTASTGTSRRAAATRSPTTGRASRTTTAATLTYADLQREVVAFANALKELGVGKGTPVGDLHGDGPGAADRDARLHAARRAAHGRLRRLLRRLALRRGSTTWAARC